jgi:hypothetical protein
VVARPWPAKPLPAWREGQGGLFLPLKIPQEHARALWLGVRASRAAGRPIGRARGRGRASQRSGESALAVWGEREKG